MSFLSLRTKRCRAAGGTVKAQSGEARSAVEIDASGGPILGRQLEVKFLGPIGEHAHDFVEVLLRVDAAQPA